MNHAPEPTSNSLLHGVDQLGTTDLTAADLADTLNHTSQTVRLVLEGVSTDGAVIQHGLDTIEPERAQGAEAGLRLALERSGPGAGVTGNTGSQDPVRVDNLALSGQVVVQGVQSGVVTSRTAHGSVTETHGVVLGNTVDDILETVTSVLADLLGTVLHLIVVDLVCAVGLDQVEVVGRAGGDRREAAANSFVSFASLGRFAGKSPLTISGTGASWFQWKYYHHKPGREHGECRRAYLDP